jgi:hypothetical protein
MFGLALTAIPIELLRLVVGALLLVFGLNWLRKGLLRVGTPSSRRRRLFTSSTSSSAPRGRPRPLLVPLHCRRRLNVITAMTATGTSHQTR